MLRPDSRDSDDIFMKRGFYNILAAQFLSSLADNALLIAAIALLASIQAPDWMTPLLKLFFVLSYVGLAAWVGIFADLMPKGRVMFITNAVKVFGCLLMLFGSHRFCPTPSSASAQQHILLPSTAFSPNFFHQKNWLSPMAGSKV